MAEFTTVRSEGGLLPPDLLHRIAGGDAELGGLAPRDYGLAGADRLGEAAARSWARAKAYWAAFRAATEELDEAESGVTPTREQWLLPLLRELGYRDVEFRGAAEAVGGRRYPISHRAGPVPLNFVSFRQSIDRATPGGTVGLPRLSPHALLQEYLNVADGALYGIVSNGLVLRLLRDNASLTRQAYVEFDLGAMLEGGVYADFVLLYLVLHRSRLPMAGAEAGGCWLERWRERAEAQGARALGELRKGVEQAIVALGAGFLAHPANDRLRARLAGGGLSVQEYYQQLLRVIYRLIFLFAAEERDLVFPAGAGTADKRRYLDHYSASRLRDLARKQLTDDRHDDLWRGLRVTFGLLAGEREGLGVPALGGGLFDAESCPDLDGALLRNHALAEAVLRLSWVRVRKVTRRVNYRDMDAEELGGIYEGLLERQPQIRAEAAYPRFELVGSSQRKQTGSYYTPTPLVQELIRSALEPVIADRMGGAQTTDQRRRALLGITVCDPASGSGHFLLAAGRRLALELARIEAGDAEPSPAQLRAALREIIRKCLYAVDVNPLAIDLCKLALWLEGHDPGRPLTFLDLHVKLGNSLIGATSELLAGGIPDGAFEPVTGDEKAVATAMKKRNRKERPDQPPLGVAPTWDEAEHAFARAVEQIAALPEDGPKLVADQRASYDAYQSSAPVEASRLALDTWTAAFFWRLAPAAPDPPTTAALAGAAPDRPPTLTPQQRREVERLRREHRFFHWPLEFPDVFDRGGFDCVLGNPPWERIKLQEEEFFADRDPEIAGAANKAARQRLIDELAKRETGRALYAEFQAAKRAAEAHSKFLRESGRFPLAAVGDVNLYPLFTEHDRGTLDDRGRAGLVLPTGIVTDDTTKHLFQALMRAQVLVSVHSFENESFIFPGVHHAAKFCLLTVAGRACRQTSADFLFFARNTNLLRDMKRHFSLAADDLALLNPITRACCPFRTGLDADLTKGVYRRVPPFVEGSKEDGAWNVQLLRMFDMSGDSKLFHNDGGPNRVPLYEAKLFYQYEHRLGTYAHRDLGAKDTELPRPSVAQIQDPSFAITPRYWLDRSDMEARLSGRWDRPWLVVYRRITNATNERTAIAAVLPRVAVGDGGPAILPPVALAGHAFLLLANLNSLALDFVARQKIGGLHLDFHQMRQLPILPPSAYNPGDSEFIRSRVLELVYSAWDLQPFARDLGYDGPPFGWDEQRRALLRAELDAYYAALYGLTRDELRYILDPSDVYGQDFPGETFRVLKNNEIKKYGEYRTRRLVLEAWDRLGLEPRNRDGRYDAGDGGQGSGVRATRSQSGPNPLAPFPEGKGEEDGRPAMVVEFTGDAERVGAERADTGELGGGRLAEAVALCEEPVGGQPQQPLPGISEAELGLRQKVLRKCLDLLRGGEGMTAREIAKRLAVADARISKHLINSVLSREGAGHVRHDAATGKYRIRVRGSPE